MPLGVARRILPPMPAGVYRRLDDTDLEAMYAYLTVQRPIANLVPEPGSHPSPSP